MLTRRFFLGGLIAAPAVIAADKLMPVRSIIQVPAFEPYLEVINLSRLDDGTEWKITSKIFGDPSNTQTWRDMMTAMHGWTAPHDKPVQSIRYVAKDKIYEHGDYRWVPMAPHIAALRLHAKV